MSKKNDIESHYQLIITYSLNNKKRIISALIALIVLLFFPFFVQFYFWLNECLYIHLLFKKIRPDFLFTESKHGFADLLIALTEHTTFALIVYSIFTDVIERWLGHQIREVPKFNSKLFISKIKKSSENVIIHETFVRELIENHGSDFRNSLEDFLHNSVRTYPDNLEGRIKILILHPFCEDNKIRYSELEKDIDIKPLEQFQKKAQQLLIEMQDIQKHINTLAKPHMQNKKRDFFELKISYDRPSFSLYYCDKYASVSYYEKIPSVLAPQIVFSNANKSEAAKKQKIIFEKQWGKAVYLPMHYEEQLIEDIEDIKKFGQVINDFKDITVEKEPGKIREKLENIASLCDNNHLIAVELVNYLECNHKKTQVNYIDINEKEHYNIFGTGGDNQNLRSINISTIASILASHIKVPTLGIDGLSIVKSGTLAVTCKVGSQQFYEALQSTLLNNEEKYKHVKDEHKKYLNYNPYNQSIYLPITYFGYVYREIVRKVRVGINSKHITDIYKVIFPTANLTDYKAVINGVSREIYIDYFEVIYQNKLKTGIILYNTSGIDELYKGHNQLFYYQNGRLVHRGTIDIIIPAASEVEYDKFFKESNAQHHVDQFFQLFNQNAPVAKEIKETIAYNVALFIQLQFLVNKQYSSNSNNEKDFGTMRLKELMEIVYSQFFL